MLEPLRELSRVALKSLPHWIHEPAVLSIRSASDELVRSKDSQASFVGRLRRLFVQDLPILVTTHSRVLFLEFHADDEVPVQSRPIQLGLQLANLI